MSKKKKIIISSTILLLIILVVAGIQLKNGGPEAIEVQTAPVTRHKIVQTVTATGRIQPKDQVKISADVSAKITNLPVEEGDWVEKGDLLLELDRERYVASVERAEANLRSTESNARLAKENMIRAEKDYNRTKELFEKNLESKAALDGMFATFQVEKARYESELDQVEQARASLKQANDDLSKTTIFAPMAGTISQLNKEVGEIALGSQFQEDVIMIISNLSGMEALVDVDENDVVSVAIGDTAHVEVDALPTTIFRGVVTEIANSAKITGTGTADQKTEFEVKAAVIGTVDGAATNGTAVNPEIKIGADPALSKLRPGMTASCDIITDTRQEVLGIPIQCVTVRTVDQLEKKPADEEQGNVAVAGEQQSQYTPDKDGFVEIVFVVNGEKVEARQVKTGIQSDTHIEILDGLEENEEIVVGNYRAISKDLQNGSNVTKKNNGGAKT